MEQKGLLTVLMFGAGGQVVLKMSLTAANSPREKNTEGKYLLDNWLILY